MSGELHQAKAYAQTYAITCAVSLFAGSDGKVILHYKELAVHPVWLPPLDPNAETLSTDPAGIVVFDSAPPDPLLHPPAEVPLNAKRPRQA